MEDHVMDSARTIAQVELPVDYVPPLTEERVTQDLVTSHSINSTFDSCPRKFEFVHVYGVGAAGGESGFAADVGTALHEAIQAWASIFLHPDSDRSDETMRRAEDAGLYELLAWWPWLLEEEGVEQKKQAVRQRSLDRSIDMYLTTIHDAWWGNWELAVTDSGEVCIEIPWRIEHNSQEKFFDHRGVERRFVTQGKIDFVLRHRTTGEIRVVDIKTTNKSVVQLDASYRFSAQGAGYAMVLGAVLGIDWRTVGLKVTYLGCKFGLMSESGVEPVPVTYTYDETDIEDMLRSNQDRMDRMTQYGKDKWWPRRSGGCEAFGRICPFFSVCHRRDSKFVDQWLAFSKEYNGYSRIYETKWLLES